MKLSEARAIHRDAQTRPSLWVGKAQFNDYGASAELKIMGENQGYHLQGSKDGKEWWVAHFVYGGAYAKGSTRQEALMNFAKRFKGLKEKIKRRKLAEKIVKKYGIGPVIENEGNTWVARLNDEIVAKAATYQSAMKMALRVEKEQS